MIRAMMWKEYREHRAIWLTLALVGAAALFGLSQLMAPGGLLSNSSARESLQSVAILFAWTYGLVCGAMLLANEHESGTITFLDILPAKRLELWLVKCFFGLLLLGTHVAVLAGLVVALGITETVGQFSVTLLGMAIFGLIALGWSLLFSAWGDNVLNVIGFSFLGQIAGALTVIFLFFSVGILVKMFWHGEPSFYESLQVLVACLGFFGLVVGPIIGSARSFTQLDRQRARAARKLSRPPADLSEWDSWRRLIWLSFMQMRRLLFVMIFFALVVGFMHLFLGPAAWPALTLLIGVLCGVTNWSDEQMCSAFRFLGDQRFPLGRVWIVKVGMRFALAAFASFVVLLPSLIRAAMNQILIHSPSERSPFAIARHVPFFADLFRSNLVGPVVPVWTHLSIWLLYGFTAGNLCSLLFRKSLVAAVVALGSSGMLLCLWVPSLVGIGLHFWQLAGVPLILLVASWTLMPAWTADRLLERGTLLRLGSLLLGAALWTVGGLWYRVVEIPDVPDAFDIPAFAASIPSMDVNQNAAGMEIHAAWHEVDLMARDLFPQNSVRPGRPMLRNEAEMNGGGNELQREIQNVLAHGWPNQRPKLDDKLDFWFEKDWYKHLKRAAQSPLGVVEDAKLLTINAHTKAWHLQTYLAQVLAVRGLQLQARGDHKAFVDNFGISLALSRNIQNHAPPHLVRIGREAELISLRSLDRWLEKLPGEPELLERVRDVLLQHKNEIPLEIDTLRTSFLIAQNTLEHYPDTFVQGELGAMKAPGLVATELEKSEMDLISLLWRIPWELERHQRLLRVVFEGSLDQRKLVANWGGFYMGSLNPPESKDQEQQDRRATAELFATLLKVGLRLYQARNGEFPDNLSELASDQVPGLKQRKYLPAVPPDPFDGKPFRYRVSLDKHGRQKAVLWSIGEDNHDDGGKKPGNHHTVTFPGEDLIYNVPQPPR